MMDTSFYPRKRKKRLRDKKKLKIVLKRLKKIDDFDRTFTAIMVKVHSNNLNQIGKERREYKEYKNKLKSR